MHEHGHQWVDPNPPGNQQQVGQHVWSRVIEEIASYSHFQVASDLALHTNNHKSTYQSLSWGEGEIHVMLLAHLGVHPVSGGVITVLDGQTKLSTGAEGVRVASDGVATNHGNLWDVQVHPLEKMFQKKTWTTKPLMNTNSLHCYLKKG